MADREELQTRLAFRRTVLSNLRTAYIELSSGGVKSYTVAGRSLTKFDLGTLAEQIRELENEIDVLTTRLEGSRPRKVFGVVPTDW